MRDNISSADQHPSQSWPKARCSPAQTAVGAQDCALSELTDAQSQEIIARLKAREPFEAIARSVGCRIESVKLRATRLKQNGTVELHSPGAKPKSQRRKRDVDADIDSERHAKRVRRLDEREKGQLQAYFVRGDTIEDIAAAIGRHPRAIKK